MARLARAVAPGVPHHITQRGNRRQQVFFNIDEGAYIAGLAAYAQAEAVEVLAYCLMPNHVHLILVPPHEGSLSAVLSRLHRDYARRINFRERWRGYLYNPGTRNDFLLAKQASPASPPNPTLRQSGDTRQTLRLFRRCSSPALIHSPGER